MFQDLEAQRIRHFARSLLIYDELFQPDMLWNYLDTYTSLGTDIRDRSDSEEEEERQEKKSTRRTNEQEAEERTHQADKEHEYNKKICKQVKKRVKTEYKKLYPERDNYRIKID